MPDYMLYVGTHAIDDPTRAGLVFAAARGAIGNGRQTKVALLGDAVLLMIPEIATNTHLAGPQRGSVKDLIDQLKKQPDKFEIYAWDSCCVARGVTQKQVEAQGGKFMTSQQFAQLSFDAKHVISF